MPSPGPDKRGLEKYQSLSSMMAHRVMIMRRELSTKAACRVLQLDYESGRGRAVLVRAVIMAEFIMGARLFVRSRNREAWDIVPGNEEIWHRINMLDREGENRE